jgi:membrane dipeptidase
MASVVFDYAAGTPWVMNEAIEAAIESAARDGASVATVIANETTRQYRTDPDYRSAWRGRFQAAGVDVASVTIRSGAPAEDLFRWQARFDADDRLRKVLTPADARAAGEDSDAVGVLLNTQNLGRSIQGGSAGLEDLWNAGVRIFQPTYNTQNGLGAGCYERSGSGLSNRGLEVVDQLNELGGILDLSHCGHETTMDAIEAADGPVAATHVSCAAIADHPRAKTDAELRAIAERDGYVGVVGVPWFLAPNADDPGLEVFFEHLEHAVSVVGPGRIGIGTDFGNVDAGVPSRYVTEARERAVAAGFPEGYGEGYGGGFGRMRRYQDWPELRAGLEQRFDTQTMAGILGGNFLAFWERDRAA